MKKALETLVSLGKNVGRNIGNSIKRRAKLGLVGLALATPFIFIDRARGEEYIEGSVNAHVSLDGIGGNSCGVAFVEGASYGLDDYDVLYEEPPGPPGGESYVKALGSVDGRPASGIANPPLPKVVGSSGGASFSCSFVVGEGKMVVLDNASYSFSASGSIDGCRVTVNGVDLSSGEDIPGGEISGTFGPGEHSIGDISINVEYVGTGGNGGDPNDPNPPDPNTPLDAGPHILRIDNVHQKMLNTVFELIYEKGASDGIDVKDKEYDYTFGLPVPPLFIVSNAGNKYLTLDSRNTDSNSPVYLEQVLWTDYKGSISSLGGDNALVFSFPSDEGTNHKFGERILTFQEYDINEPNSPNASEPNVPAGSFPSPNAKTYPVYLVRDIIADGNGFGTVLLPKMPRWISPGTFHYFILRTDSPSRELAVGDFNKDGRVDVNDCNAVETAMGHTGNSVYDIASCDPNYVNDPNKPNDPNNPNDPTGLYIGTRPDGVVDGTDKRAIYYLMERDAKRREETVSNMSRETIYNKMDEDVLKAVKESYDEMFEK